MGLINYLGKSKVIKRICQLLNVTDVQDGEGHSLVDENGIAVVTGGGSGSSTLADLTDVDVTGAQDGNVLALNGTSGKWEEKGLATVASSGSYNDLSNNPTKLSDFSNDSGFITNTVNNLTNYYRKSETYTQAEVNALISSVVTIDIEVVQTLPTTDISTTTIYLLPKQTAGTDDVYDEYINTTGTSSGWELIGSTQVDLSNYYTKSEVDALIPDELADLADDSTHRLVTDTEKSTWSAKVSDNPTFSEASTRANIASGESFATILGKIKKFFTDLKTVAFTGSYSDLSNQPTIPAAVYMGQIGAGNSIRNVLVNTAPVGDTLWQTQQADDSPTKGSVSSVLMCKHTGNGSYSYVFHFGSGVIRYATTGNPAPSSLTWTQIDARNANYANSAGSATDSSKEPKISWTYKNNWNYWRDSANKYHLHYLSGNQSINFNGSIGNLKYRTSTFDINFPVTLTSVHSIQVTAMCGNDIVGVTVQSYSTSAIKLWLWASTSGTKTIQIFIDVIST